jgi:hypothetical protein
LHVNILRVGNMDVDILKDGNLYVGKKKVAANALTDFSSSRKDRAQFSGNNCEGTAHDDGANENGGPMLCTCTCVMYDFENLPSPPLF